MGLFGSSVLKAFLGSISRWLPLSRAIYRQSCKHQKSEDVSFWFVIFPIVFMLSAGSVIANDRVDFKSSRFEQDVGSDEFKEVTFKFYDKDFTAYVGLGLSIDPDSAFIIASMGPSNSIEDYYTRIALTMRWFLKTYKFGKDESAKHLAILLQSDLDDYRYFYRVPVKQLRLLNNRSMDAQDLLKFEDGGIVYPMKTIFKRGQIFDFENPAIINEKLTVGFAEFLTDFDLSPLVEGAVEAWYEDRKTK